MNKEMLFVSFSNLFRRRPDAVAIINGSEDHPTIRGVARFYTVSSGVMVRTEVKGLPSPDGKCASPVFAYHIHAQGSCSGNKKDPFANSMGHYDKNQCPHPYHSGDLCPLFGVKGRAISVFLTDRFTVSDILGKSIIIHASPDDFTSQPSGNSGTRLACGLIVKG
ncbi:MAG: superoxide dismutase family protein [Clostridia bacterium]|nr:superoxide dismutase family protein [Clostridia bacterium]